MLFTISYLIGMLRILANEVEDLDDGEERIATPVTRSLARNDREEAVA